MQPKILAFAICLCVSMPAFAVKQRMELVTTDRKDVAPGGLIHVEGSTGELNITGWDQPSVEVVTSRYVFREERERDKTTDELKRIQVVSMVANNGEMTITTAPKHKNGIHLDYQIMVPRTSRLLIRHRTGDVIVTDVAGDIDAKAGAGDIVVQLPEIQHYMIDAKVRFGTVYSDFNNPRHHDWIGEKLVEDAPAEDASAKNAPAKDAKAPARQITLRVGAGGISIQKRQPPPPDPDQAGTKAGL